MSAQKVDAVRCAVDECERQVKARGLCSRCYGRRYRDGEFTDLKPKVNYRAALADDIDDEVVRRLTEGQKVAYTSFERREAVRRLDLQGVSRNAIARLIGVNPRQIYFDLDRFGLVQHRDSA